jgi:hypothetical protein
MYLCVIMNYRLSGDIAHIGRRQREYAETRVKDEPHVQVESSVEKELDVKDESVPRAGPVYKGSWS